MEAVEDFESRPYKAVTFPVERDKELQELRELKMPKVWPGKADEEPVRKMENEVMNAILTSGE